ncbi:Dynein regulatory complex subunit 7 [Clonorchis sinensis]|uniref:Dynein regulatory complex subunit 7 n=1 Tax=Clonorchis sinensis TaxID=79923 RepID=A0A8T1LZN0_CLOSI|nr:Dynein regulatory complex subunit 7 [Clonorchis sinensis]
MRRGLRTMDEMEDDEIIYPEDFDYGDQDETVSHHTVGTSTHEATPKADPTCPDTSVTTVGPSDESLIELNPVYLPKAYELLPETFDANQFPKAYKVNNAKEARLVEYCQNFRRQYADLCPDRTRLLLTPKNECGVEKFVCTTLHPIQLSYPELYTWEGAASFVSDFLEFVPLVPSTELPKRLLSPSTTISIQKGSCFEYANLLCSLLLGVGYDAYVVCGYATRECCYMDQTRLVSPYKKKPDVRVESEEESESKKYMIRPPKDLTSQYEKACLAKELHAEAEQLRLNQEEAEREEAEACKPPKDPLHGLRVHAWVLVLAGRRDVPEAFFIEPLTGVAHPLEASLYLGIESLWNANNYWVNMQDCSNGIGDMEYDLDNGQNWEYLLPSGSVRIKPAFSELEFPRNQLSDTSDWPMEGIHVQSTLNYELVSRDSTQSSHIVMSSPFSAHRAGTVGAFGQQKTITNTGDLPNKEAEQSKKIAGLEDKLLLMDLPPTWTSPIRISQELYEFRYPGGQKTALYRRCKVEKFAPFSQPDGLIFRLTNYADRERLHPTDVLEKYAQRADKLLSRFREESTNAVNEAYDHGRKSYHLAEHHYYRNQQGPQARRTMVFYHTARVDGLEKREQTPTTMKEYYVGRSDRMCYREVLFGAKIKKFGPAQLAKDADGGALVCVTSSSQLAIDKITERFTRDPSKEADDDVAERIFFIAEERILLTYHIGDDRIIACTREFIKPPPSEDRRNSIQLYSDTHSTFQDDPDQSRKSESEVSNETEHLKHYAWIRNWRKTSLNVEPNQKRVFSGDPITGTRSKRRTTVNELQVHEQVEKENQGTVPQRRQVTGNKSHGIGEANESRQRHGLLELPNQRSWTRRHSSLSNKHERSKGAFTEGRRSASQQQVDNVRKLNELSLSDEIQLVKHHWPFRRRMLPVPKKTEFLQTDPNRRPYVTESTRLIATMFRNPISALLEEHATQENSAGKSTTVGQSGLDDSSCQNSRMTDFPSPYLVWLPESPVDQCNPDEYHWNHAVIYRYLFTRDMERTSLFNPEFLKQNSLTEDIRATLCDWMIKVQQYLKLRTETLHLAVSIVDQYTWLKTNMNPIDYQLVGITALFVAAKFVERFAPSSATLCYLTENSYKPRQVLEFEHSLLRKLDFDLAIPLPHHFLTRAVLACSDLTTVEKAKVELISCYLFELSLTETSIVGFSASIRCAAAVRLARHLINSERIRIQQTQSSSPLILRPDQQQVEPWPEMLIRSVGHEDTPRLRAVCLTYVRALRRFKTGFSSTTEKFEAAFHKFSNRGYKGVAQCSTIKYCELDTIERSLCSSSTSEPNS